MLYIFVGDCEGLDEGVAEPDGDWDVEAEMEGLLVSVPDDVYDGPLMPP